MNRALTLKALTGLLDAAQRNASRLAAVLHPDGPPAAAAAALQHALECAQLQLLTLSRLLHAPPCSPGQQPDKEGTTPCPADSPATP